MPRTRNLSIWISLAVALALLASAAPAGAARPLELGFTGYTDDAYSDPDPAVHDLWLDRTVSVGAGIVVLPAFWDQIAPASRPADPTNPTGSNYEWKSLDAQVRNASAHGLTVVIIVTGAPRWAEGPNRPPLDDDKWPAGSWKPDSGELAKFATALATRYSGGYTDPSDLIAGPIPAVHLWEVWAEPNLSVNLSPQYENGKQVSVDHYREMLNAFYAAAKAVNGQNTIVTGGLAPYGDDPGGLRTRPLIFYRDLLCLKGRQDLRATKCSTKASFDVLGHNPISLSGGPEQSAVSPDDVSTPDLGHVTEVLRAAEHAHTIQTPGRHPLWATEFWWMSDPPIHDPGLSVKPKQQALRIEQSLYLFWKAGASVAIMLQIRDNSLPFIGGTGLYYKDGDPKPAVTAFRFPFVTERKSKGTVRAWGRAPVAGKLRIERHTGGGWRSVKTATVGDQAVFTANLKLSGRAKLRARVGGDTSLPWSQK
jgi:hypothetical protein